MHGVLGARTASMLAPRATALQYQQTYGPPRASVSARVSQVMVSSLKSGVSFRMYTPFSIVVAAMFMVLCSLLQRGRLDLALVPVGGCPELLCR